MYRPKYLRIVELLRRRFGGGELAPGDTLPGEIALAHELGISRRTLRSALQVLEDDGFIIRKKGVGSILAPAEMHCRRRHSDVAVIYSAAPDAEHNYDFLLRRTWLADGIIRGMAARGHWLRVVPLDENNRAFSRDEIFRKGIDGFIFPGIDRGVLDVLREVVRRKMPHVIWESALELRGVNAVVADDEQAGYDMIDMLLKEGEESIAFIGGALKSPFRNTANRRRFNGARRAMNDRHAAMDGRFFRAVENFEDEQPSGLQRREAAELVREMLAQNDMPRTVVLSSLLVADVFVEEVKKSDAGALKNFRMLTFHGSCDWNTVRNLREVLAMEYFSCDNDEWLRRGTEMLDCWLNDPAYRVKRVFVPCAYHKPAPFMELAASAGEAMDFLWNAKIV